MNVETCYSVFVLIRAKYVVNVEKNFCNSHHQLSSHCYDGKMEGS